MLGQLQLIPAQSWGSTLGPDAYAIVRPLTTSTPTPPYLSFFLTGTPAFIGSDLTLEASQNRIQTHYNAQAT